MNRAILILSLLAASVAFIHAQGTVEDLNQLREEVGEIKEKLQHIAPAIKYSIAAPFKQNVWRAVFGLYQVCHQIHEFLAWKLQKKLEEAGDERDISELSEQEIQQYKQELLEKVQELKEQKEKEGKKPVPWELLFNLCKSLKEAKQDFAEKKGE